MATKSKKQLMDEADPLDSGQQKAQALQSGLSLHEVDAKVYGGSSVRIPPSGRQTAEPIALDAITPDPTQPRREVPLSVRRKAREHGMAEWLVWYQMAEKMAGREIALTALLRGEGEASETEVTGQPLVDSFLSLVALAASINREGLTNAITVTTRGMDRYQIETGERRYQAYRLLYGALNEEKFARIAARVESKSDVWKQASENGSRKPLNAIGMSRQLALLVMDLYRGKDGADFVPYDKMIQDADCDRMFYAQVADGNIWRIPKGQSERILQATGLKSKSQLANYRALLDVSDEVWMQADEEDWTEGRIREHILTLKNPDRFTTVNVSPQNMNQSTDSTRLKESHLIAPNAPLTYPLDGPGQKFMRTKGGKLRVQLERGEIINGALQWTVWFFDDKTGARSISRKWPMSELEEINAPSPANPFVSPPLSYTAISPTNAGQIRVGQRRLGAQGRVFEVLGVSADTVHCFEVNTRTGARMPGKPQEITLSRFLGMTDVSAPTPAARAAQEQHAQTDLEAARLAIMGPDDDADETETLDRLPEAQEALLIALMRNLPVIKNAATRQALIEKGMVKVMGQPEHWHFEMTPRGLAYASQYALHVDYTPPGGWRVGMQVIFDGPEKHYEGAIRQVTDTGVSLLLKGAQEARFVSPLWLRPVDDGTADTNGHALTTDFKIGMKVVTQNGHVGVVTDVTERKVWVKIEGIDIDTPQPFWAETLMRARDGEPSQAVDNLPDWASNGRLVTDVQRDIAGKVISSYWSANKAVWMVRVGFEDHTSTIPLDLLAAHEAEALNDLPSWAIIGAPVMHMGGDACEIIQCIYDTTDMQWLLKVLILSSGVEDTAPITDFMPMTAQVATTEPVAPREPHPALRQRSGVIIEEQRMLRRLSDTALDFDMKTEAAALASLPVSTANHILTQLNTSGKQSVIEQADREYQMAYAVYMRGIEIAYQVRANKIMVAEDLEAEQQKRGA